MPAPSPKRKVPATETERPHLFAAADRDSTKAKILDSAFRRLAEDGYAALSVREIAKDAGVNHALINYHFQTKDQLVIAVLDEANRQLLERQQRMYRGPGRFAEKWEQARRFYERDLASGFVRVQAELWAASMSNPDLREKFVPRIRAWKEVVRSGVRDAFAMVQERGVDLPAPFTPEVVATWISEFWLGMEFSQLICEQEERLTHRSALDAMHELLVRLDAQVHEAAVAPPSPNLARRPPNKRRRK